MGSRRLVWGGGRWSKTNEEEYNAMAKAENPFGDGYASVKIRKILEKELL